MNRFRFTMIAICLVLLYLGVSDLSLWFNNLSPQAISISQLEQDGAPQQWLSVSGGYQDLDRAISTSGTVEMEALLIPLVTHPDQQHINIMMETRDPELLRLFREYHLHTDTIPEKQTFRQEHAAAFKGQKNVTGMLVTSLIARSNQQKLMELAQQTGLDIDDKVIFLSEGKEPGKWRGVFFAIIGFIGLIKGVLKFKKSTPNKPTDEDITHKEQSQS